MDFSKIRHALFFGMLALVTVVFIFLLKPFFFPLFWAATFATIFYPLYRWFNKFIKYPNLSATTTLVVIFLIIVVPAALFGSLLVRETLDLYGSLDESGTQELRVNLQGAINAIKHNPYTQKLQIDEQLWIGKISEVARTIFNFFFTGLKNFTQNSIVFIVMFIVMLYALFFFLRDGEKFLKLLMHLSPLGDKQEKMLYNKFTSAARATIKGTLLIGGLQGILGGLLFLAVGIKGAILWGLIMAFLSFIPGVGSSLIYLPAGAIMLLTGHPGEGLLIIFFGLLVISTIDNFLRPILVGKGTQLHPLLILFSTLGGIALFGASGFVLGPVITALLLAFWEMYEHSYKNDLSHN